MLTACTKNYNHECIIIKIGFIYPIAPRYDGRDIPEASP